MKHLFWYWVMALFWQERYLTNQKRFFQLFGVHLEDFWIIGDGFNVYSFERFIQSGPHSMYGYILAHYGKEAADLTLDLAIKRQHPPAHGD